MEGRTKMKLKTLLAALAVAGVAASVAIAAPPPGKGKGPACKPGRSIVLKGEFVSAGGTGFAMTVKSGNAAAKPFAGKQLTVAVETATRFTKAKLADLKAGDKVKVQGYACKADATALTLVARRVTAKGPKSGDDDADKGTTTGTTTTTDTTTTTGTTTTG
jgi:hypothetical protein